MRFFMKRKSLAFSSPAALAFAALAGVTALSGCSNNPYPAGETSKAVYYTTFGDLKTLDPTLSYTVSEAAVIDCIYPSFFKYDNLKQAPYKLDLALGAAEPTRTPITATVQEKGKSVTKQGEEWTFHIKKGLKFQDDPCFPGGKGREITAADFIYSFRRMADPELPCPVLSFFQDKILGMDAYVNANIERQKSKQGADYAAPVAGFVLDSKDPYTFKLRLNQPYPQLRFLMTMHFTTPIAHEAVEKYKAEFARHTVGSGAYVMTEYTPKQRITLEKNPNRPYEVYPSEGDPGDKEKGYLQDAGKQLPLCDKVVFNYIKESVTSWNLFQQGYLDAAAVTRDNNNQVLAGQGQLSPEMQTKGVKLRKSTTPNISYFAFNMKDPVWGGYTDKGRKLRQAVSLSIDRQAMIDVLYQGRGTVANTIVPPGIFGYDPKYKNPYSRFDIARAKQLLSEAGYPNGIDPATGKRLELNYDVAEAGAPGRQLYTLVKNQIEQSGISVNVQSWQSVTWEERVHEGKMQFFGYGWLADYPDPENFVFLLYGPNAANGGINYANYDNPEYNRLFEQMRAMDDGPARLAIINKMRDISVEDAPWIYNRFDEGLGISYDWVQNNKPHGVSNDSFKYVGVDGDKRAQMQRRWNQPNGWPLLVLAGVLGLASIPAAATARARRNRSVRRKPSTTVTPPASALDGGAAR